MPQWMKRLKSDSILTLCILLLASGLSAQASALQSYLDSLLAKHPDYLQAQSRYQKEKALFAIEKSLYWADLNLSRQQYDNDFTRDEITSSLEHSKVKEKDTRDRIELAKQFFPKDYDNVTNDIGNRLEVLRYRDEARLAYYTSAADVLEELAEWYEADAMAAVIQSRLDILQEQNQLLEELNSTKGIDPEVLLDNLKEIGDRQEELADYKRLTAFYQSKYGALPQEFISRLQSYPESAPQPDTLAFTKRLQAMESARRKALNAISRRISLNLALFYLPEVNLSLSYNWRTNRQDWDIDDAGIPKLMQRNQDEEFPEAKLEFSLPLNYFSNAKGKLDLLKAYRSELDYRARVMELEWQEFAAERLTGYQAAVLELKRAQRVHQLSVANLEVQRQKLAADSAKVEKNTLKLQREILKAEEARVEAQKAKLVRAGESLLFDIFTGMSYETE